MAECNLDHTLNDVILKLENQRAYMPESISTQVSKYLKERIHTQEELNELFHLLKKYDLATAEERAERDKTLGSLIFN